MADYAIGDLQGCYEPLQRMLEYIDFDERVDRLWFVGDLVNRGPDSLKVLRFLHALPIPPIITLGNHDLHLLGALFSSRPWKGPDDTLQPILNASDGELLGHWLRKQSILHHNTEFNVVMSHAGIAPIWDLEQAKQLAYELEQTLSQDNFKEFLDCMYGNQPDTWSNDLQGYERLRVITNYFTRMRFCDREGRLNLDYKGGLDNAPPDIYPWYDTPGRKAIHADIVFGHWAALIGQSPHPNIHAIDTGCLWGGPLTALRLQDKQRFSVSGLQKK